jgi:hypothetical protein
VQKDSPGVAKDANSLPAPDGPFYAILRIYMPAPEVVNGTWKKPQNAAGCWELAIFGLLPIPANRMQLHDWLVVTAEDTTAAGSSPPPQYGQNLLPGPTLRWQCGHVGCKRLRHRGQKLKPGSTSALHCGQ